MRVVNYAAAEAFKAKKDAKKEKKKQKEKARLEREKRH